MDNPRFYRIETQTISLPIIDAPGWILDVGGGGEGVIGQLCGSRVVAIDHIPRELEEAPGDALKIIMDAGELKFLDNTFQTATAFFFLMFVPLPEMAQVFREIFRVLKPGGHWLVWDVTIPPFPGGEKDIFIVRIHTHLPNGKLIETGYGALWPDHAQTVDDFIRLAEQTDFQVMHCESDQQHFYLDLQKP